MRLEKHKYIAMPTHPIFTMSFAKVHECYLAKAAKKGRTQAEVDAIICWLTGHTPTSLAAVLASETTLEALVASAPRLNPARTLITGSICGVRVENIKEPTIQAIRYLDKLIDELAKGKPLTKILRKT